MVTSVMVDVELTAMVARRRSAEGAAQVLRMVLLDPLVQTTVMMVMRIHILDRPLQPPLNVTTMLLPFRPTMPLRQSCWMSSTAPMAPMALRSTTRC